MPTFKVLDRPVTLPAGLVFRPTKDQAARRPHGMKKAGPGNRYELTAPMDFKRGETIEIEGEPPKSLRGHLVPAKKAVPAESATTASPAPGLAV